MYRRIIWAPPNQALSNIRTPDWDRAAPGSTSFRLFCRKEAAAKRAKAVTQAGSLCHRHNALHPMAQEYVV